MIRGRVRSAFTLIEILIVVVILGILAAIVIPQYNDATADATYANLVGQLQTIRGQMGAYNVAAHTNGWPMYDAGRVATGDASFWADLVNYNYIQQPPRNPRQAAATADFVGPAPAAGVGWAWDGNDIIATDGAGAAFNELGP